MSYGQELQERDQKSLPRPQTSHSWLLASSKLELLLSFHSHVTFFFIRPHVYMRPMFVSRWLLPQIPSAVLNSYPLMYAPCEDHLITCRFMDIIIVIPVHGCP